MTNSWQMIRLLGVVSLMCGLLIVGTERYTAVRIRHNQETIMRESVARLLPGIEKQIIYGIGASGQLDYSAESGRLRAAILRRLRWLRKISGRGGRSA